MPNDRFICYVMACPDCSVESFVSKPSRVPKVLSGADGWRDPVESDSEEEIEDVNVCPSCGALEDPGHVELRESDLESSDTKALVKLWKAIGKRIPKEIREKQAVVDIQLRGAEKRKLKKKIENWIEECNFDYYVDEKQMWKDRVMILCHGPDGLPMQLSEMVTGWEIFVYGTEALSKSEMSSFRRHLNEKGSDRF